jgi:hypothetical protein
MLKKFTHFSLNLLSISLLSACCHSNPVNQSPTPKSPEQRTCLARCEQLKSACQHQFDQINQQCKQLTRQQAWLNYNAYYQDQLAHQKKPSQMKKHFNDFYNPSRCQEQLDCPGEEALCVKSCGINSQREL